MNNFMCQPNTDSCRDKPSDFAIPLWFRLLSFVISYASLRRTLHHTCGTRMKVHKRVYDYHTHNSPLIKYKLISVYRR